MSDVPLADVLAAQWTRIVAAVRDLQEDDWTRPTRLDGWTVTELVAHMAGNPLLLVRHAAVVSLGKPVLDSQSYFDELDHLGADAAARRRVAELSRAELVELLEQSTCEASESLTSTEHHQVIAGGRAPIRFGDMAFTRLVEAVVHGLDLSAVRPFEQEPEAIRLLARWFGQRLVRGHAGRTIEVRVPLATAVQIAGPDGDGPKHKRGTPPNTVELDPITWIELAAGRLSWSDAVHGFRVHASGRLADLSWVLPLLG